MHEKTTLGNAVPVNSYICNCFSIFHFGSILLPQVVFIPETFLYYSWLLILLLQVYHHLYIYQQFFYLIYMGILNNFLPLKRHYIYNLLMVCNSILFSILSILNFIQTLSYRRKITYHPLLIGFSHQLTSIQDAKFCNTHKYGYLGTNSY